MRKNPQRCFYLNKYTYLNIDYTPLSVLTLVLERILALDIFFGCIYIIYT